ncbi:hypothetical protein EAX61_05530 [Dokdonia sinensis]|uniref:Uncharacterized protein n=1 Tax=Dokdonia sinensis TaxID=2479847 RepID=A0A3M0G7Q2_9FLAO|nr:hypothetical protein [Dokdonia sinensis]RMB60944.1 hypothetical protein EAX61_05530 [Dokdonia sinensis]
MKVTFVEKGFILAGLSNILGVLLFSRLFTNEVMMHSQPEVMSYFGLISIILWGLAYIAVYQSYEYVPLLLLVFVIEKFIYVILWLLWIITHSLAITYEKDLFAGIFYTIYGVNDSIFGIFFAWVYVKMKSVQTK